MLFRREDIIAAIMLMEDYSEKEATERVDKAFPSLNAPSYCGGSAIYGRGGVNRYYIHNFVAGDLSGLYRLRLSAMHISLFDGEETIAKATQLGLDVS